MRGILVVLIALVLTVCLCYAIEAGFFSGWEDRSCPDNDCGSLLNLDDDDSASFDEEEVS